MDQNNSLLADSPNVMRPFEKSPLSPPATYGYYRSRIYTSNININPLIAACDQLLSLIVTIQSAEFPDDSAKFLKDLSHEIRAFEHRAQIANYDSNTIIAARYALCSLVDEVISSTPWGQQKNWQVENLLSLFHSENYGGVRFFSIIDRAIENSSANMHLIELLYLFLNFGFTGKHKDTINGQNELLAIVNRLYQIIGQQFNRAPKNILISELKAAKQPSYIIPTRPPIPTNHKKLFAVATGAAIIISGLIYLSISIKLKKLSSPIYTTIEQIQKNKSENQL